MEKYFKIGEISKLYNIGADSLRYYEELGIIKPQRSQSGYRLYSINDIWRLNVIRDLRELGFSMEKIKGYLDCHSLDSTFNLLQEEKEIINKKIKKLKELQKNVNKRAKALKEAQDLELNKIEIKEIKPRKCYLLTEGYNEDHEMDVLIKKLINLDKERFYIIGNTQIGTVIPIKESVIQDRLKYQSVFLIDSKGKDILPGGKYLTVSYKGLYKKSSKWITELIKFAKSHNLEPQGEILEILWVDIHSSDDTNEHITELQLRVE